MILDENYDIDGEYIDRRKMGARILARKSADLARAVEAILDPEATENELVNRLIGAASAGNYATALLRELGWTEVRPGGWDYSAPDARELT